MCPISPSKLRRSLALLMTSATQPLRMSSNSCLSSLLSLLSLSLSLSLDWQRTFEAYLPPTTTVTTIIVSCSYLFDKAGSHYVGGSIHGFQLPVHYDFVELRRMVLCYQRQTVQMPTPWLIADSRFVADSFAQTTSRAFPRVVFPTHCRFPNPQPNASITP
jgi:hypothetical protein